MNDFRVTFLGTGGTIPTQRRALAAFYVARGGDKWLFDCGEGTQRQLWAATGGLPDLDGIFLTHYHADHTLGITSIISTMHLYGRTRPISVYGPTGLRDSLAPQVQLMPKKARPLIRWCEVGPGEVAARMEEYEIRPFQTKHAGGRAQGYVIEEYTKPGKIDAALCAGAGLTGPDMGAVKRGETVKGIRPEDVVGPPTPGKKVVITGDTALSQDVTMAAYGADLLIHDATFLVGDSHDKDHSTAEDAGVMGRRTSAKMLAPTHIATRNNVRAIQEEASRARGDAAYVHVPYDLETYDISAAQWRRGR